MLCYAMPCHAMLRCAVLCYAMLCYAMLCYAMLCYAMLCYAMLRYATFCASYTMEDQVSADDMSVFEMSVNAGKKMPKLQTLGPKQELACLCVPFVQACSALLIRSRSRMSRPIRGNTQCRNSISSCFCCSVSFNDVCNTGQH